MHPVFLISLINWISLTCIVDGMDNEHWASCLANAHIDLFYLSFGPRFCLPGRGRALDLDFYQFFVCCHCKVSRNPIRGNLHDYGSSGRRENPHIIIICWAYCAEHKEIRSWRRVCKCSENSCRDENSINRKLENCVTYHLSHNNFLIISSGYLRVWETFTAE